MQRLPLILLSITILPLSLSAEEIYKWTSEDGVVHYSNIQGDSKARLAELPKISYGEYKVDDHAAPSKKLLRLESECSANNKSQRCLALKSKTDEISSANKKVSRPSISIGGKLRGLKRYLCERRPEDSRCKNDLKKKSPS